MPILSICIPTYNRPTEFSRMIKSLENQLIEISDDVELVIRDDSDNLNTLKILNSCQFNKNVQISYFRGEKPIGLDSASLFLFQNSNGEFIWLFSDDDEFLPDSINTIIEIIKNDPKLNLIWVNFDVSSPKNYGLAIKKQVSRYFIDHNDAIETIGPSIGLISTQIFRREVGLKGIPLAKNYIRGFSFASTCVYLYVMTRPGNLYFANGPLILNHPTTYDEIFKKTTETGKIINNGFTVYGIDFLNIVNEYKSLFSHKAYRKLIGKNFSNLWRGMVVGWALGMDDPRGKRIEMFKRYWTFPQCWLAIVMLVLPHLLIRNLYKYYSIIKNV